MIEGLRPEGARHTTSQRIVYPADVIASRVAELGREIAHFYPSAEDLLLIAVLKGTFIFVSDLVRSIDRPLHVDFIVAASYGAGTRSSGVARLLYEPATRLDGKHVLVVEDIVDSGTTVNRLVPLLMERKPRSLELCTLLHKKLTARTALEARWVGFDAPDEFLVGYGLDHNEDYRHLPHIAAL